MEGPLNPVLPIASGNVNFLNLPLLLVCVCGKFFAWNWAFTDNDGDVLLLRLWLLFGDRFRDDNLDSFGEVGDPPFRKILSVRLGAGELSAVLRTLFKASNFRVKLDTLLSSF